MHGLSVQFAIKVSVDLGLPLFVGHQIPSSSSPASVSQVCATPRAPATAATSPCPGEFRAPRRFAGVTSPLLRTAAELSGSERGLPRVTNTAVPDWWYQSGWL